MAKQTIHTDDAPKAIGIYSQAVRAGDAVYISGQIPLDPATGELVAGDVEVQTRRVLQNLEAVLAAAGCSFADVVRTTIFLKNLGDFQTVNRVYAEVAGREPPACVTVEVSALPRGAAVEIDAIAHRGADA